MQKKLIAVAVGGALGAIAAPALAQNATVQVFGTLYGEYAVINNGAKAIAAAETVAQPYKKYDHFQTPGSEIGFRGEEKIGGGMSIWWQCASTMDYRGSGNVSNTSAQGVGSFCTRSSALGMRSAIGNVFYGNWFTPWTRVNTAGNVGANDTGIFGNAHIVAGGSSTTSVSPPSSQIANWTQLKGTTFS